MTADDRKSEERKEPHFLLWLFTNRVTLGFAAVTALLTAFYVEEDVRGKWAWQRCQRQLQANGDVFDWNAFVPGPIPEAENVFGAPRMKDWFVFGGLSDMSLRTNKMPLVKFLSKRGSGKVAEFKVIPISTNSVGGSEDAYIVLRYDSSVLTLVRRKGGDWQVKGDQAEVISLNPKTGVGLIKADNSSLSSVVEAEAAEELKRLVRQAISTNEMIYANGSQGMTLLARTPDLKPFHVVLEANRLPSTAEVKQFFPAQVFNGLPFDGNHFDIDYSATNSFCVLMGIHALSADDYLGWSDRFLPDFERVREALKRPAVRIDGNYRQPFSQPRLDYVTIRSMAQTLAQRAQCYLLLGEPERALHELTLLHDMNRLMEGKPVTLVAAMIEVAVTGIYLNVIADGFRLNAWHEPQLDALQGQLKGINLFLQLRDAFLFERAGACQLLETQSAAKIQQMAFPPTTQTIWQRLQNPKELLFSLAPRGWNQQNMVVVARLAGKYLDGFDAHQEIFWPEKLDASAREVQSSLGRVNPQNFLAAMCLPNFKKACQTLARTQTLVNEAIVACALERYRMSHGELPEDLSQLVPQFMQKVPSDVIGGRELHYRREGSGRFVLYSVGWNERDDGGVAVRKENGYVVLEEGDWPWEPREMQR